MLIGQIQETTDNRISIIVILSKHFRNLENESLDTYFVIVDHFVWL